MNLSPEHIKKLIMDAHNFLEKDNVDEISKNALTGCLKVIRDNGHLTADEIKEINSLVGKDPHVKSLQMPHLL